MERENLEQIALAIEAAGNTAYKTTDWHSAPGYMRSAEIVRRFAILEAAPEPTSVAFHNLEVANQWLRREVERARAERPSLDLCQLDRDGYCPTHTSWRCFPNLGEVAGTTDE
jgi:hypothetical protein